MAHAGFGQGLGPDEQVALIDGAAIDRQRGADQGEVVVKRRQQGIGHRAYVAQGRAVEGGAVLLIDAIATLLPQPGEGGEGVRHRLFGGAGSALEAHHQGIRLGQFSPARHPGQLQGGETILHQEAGDVGGAGEIVRYDPESHCASPGSWIPA